MDLDTQNYGGRMDPYDDIPFLLSVPDPIENPVQPARPVPLGVSVIRPGSDDAHGNEWLNSMTFRPDNSVQSAPPAPLAFPVITPLSADSNEAAVDFATAYTDMVTNLY